MDALLGKKVSRVAITWLYCAQKCALSETQPITWNDVVSENMNLTAWNVTDVQPVPEDTYSVLSLCGPMYFFKWRRLFRPDAERRPSTLHWVSWSQFANPTNPDVVISAQTNDTWHLTCWPPTTATLMEFLLTTGAHLCNSIYIAVGFIRFTCSAARSV